MSLYARVACLEPRIMCFVGKALRNEDGKMSFFHIGTPWEPLNWQRADLNQVVWKMLADYIGHPLKVLITGDEELDQLKFLRIGDITENDEISEEDYLKDWDGLKNQKERKTDSVVRPAFLACLDCHVLFPLGNAIFHPDGRVNYFHNGPVDAPLNWQNPELNQVLWKMLADHAGHHLKVLVSGDSELDQSTFLQIGDAAGQNAISREDYLKDWEGVTTTVYPDADTWAKDQRRKQQEKWGSHDSQENEEQHDWSQ